MTEDLICTGQKNGFYRFCADATAYGGLIETVKLYPTGSPYAETELSVAVLMPEELLNAVINGNSAYLFLIIVVLLIASLTASVVISHRYLRPVKKALHSIQNKEYDNAGNIPYLEINDLFDFLAEKDTEHEEEMRLLDKQRRGALSEAEQAKQQAERLADKRRETIEVFRMRSVFCRAHFHIFLKKFCFRLAERGLFTVVVATGCARKTGCPPSSPARIGASIMPNGTRSEKAQAITQS